MKAARRHLPPDATPRDPFLYVHTDEQWDALASDVRLEIVQFATSLGPCSIADLARAMNAAADGLYHHVRLLLSCGLIRRVGERHTGKRKESLYDAAAQRLRFDVDIAEGRNTDRLRELLRAHLRRAEVAFDRALRSRQARLDEPIADTLFDSASAWLDDETAEKVRRHLQSASQIMASRRRTPREESARLYSMTTTMCPLTRRRRSRG